MKLASRGKDDEELRKLSVEMRLLEQTAETLQSRIGMLNAAITDLIYANMTLEGVEQEKENSEILVPIGGSSYVKMKLANPDKVIIGLGAGVSVEKPLPEAKSMLKERQSELEKTLLSAQQQFTQVADRVNADRNRLESLLGAARQGKASSNV
jgi:prefoldin alpha subunit